MTGLGDCFLHNLPWYDKDIVLSEQPPAMEALQVENIEQSPAHPTGGDKVDRRSVRCSIYHLQKMFDDEITLPNKLPEHWDVAEKEDGEVSALAKLGRTVRIRKSIQAIERPLDEIALIETPLEILHMLSATALPNNNVLTKVKKCSFHQMQHSDVLSMLLPSPWIDW